MEIVKKKKKLLKDFPGEKKVEIVKVSRSQEWQKM